MNQIEVPEDACILMMDSKGDFKMLIPAPEDQDTMVPLPIIFMTALGLLVAKDDELFKYVMERFDEILEDYMKTAIKKGNSNDILAFFARNIEQFKEKVK